MTGAIADPQTALANRADRQPCMACCRPFARPRPAPRDTTLPLIERAPLLVCDQCWHLAGGQRVVERRLAARSGEHTLQFEPQVQALLDDVTGYDQLHPIDRVLVESGVRWSKVRRIVIPARIQLAGDVLRRRPPPDTAAAATPTTWLDAVTERILAQSTSTAAGGRFVYRSKRRRWWQICKVFGAAADRERRPLTWITQAEVAAATGCSTRTVRRVVTWLKDEGLLWEVVPGCQLPQQAIPDQETPEEAADRGLREIEAALARQARRTRARAELDAVRAGHRGAAAATAAQIALGLDIATEPENEADVPNHGSAGDRPLVTICPVYELRVPVTAQPSPPPVLAGSTSHEPARSSACPEFGHPPSVVNKDHYSSSSEPVEKNRRAPRGPEQTGPRQWFVDAAGSSGIGCQSPGQSDATDGDDNEACTAARRAGVVDKPRRRKSQAELAAEWLLTRRLDPRVSTDVPVWWLAARLREKRLLDRYHWTWDDLADLLHGVPDFPHLPRSIRNPRGWIRARLATATATLPPSKLDDSSWATFLRERHPQPPDPGENATAETVAAAERIWAITRKTVSDNCRFCHGEGYRSFGPGLPYVVCMHTPHERW